MYRNEMWSTDIARRFHILKMGFAKKEIIIPDYYKLQSITMFYTVLLFPFCVCV